MNYTQPFKKSPVIKSHLVELCFQFKDATTSMVVETKSANAGYNAIYDSLYDAYDALWSASGADVKVVELTLKDKDNNAVVVSDDEYGGVDWLEQMLVAASIVEFDGEKKVAA